jgi:hypothetical protein
MYGLKKRMAHPKKKDEKININPFSLTPLCG